MSLPDHYVDTDAFVTDAFRIDTLAAPSDLPEIPPEVLSDTALKQRFKDAKPWVAEPMQERTFDRPPGQAAVLIPIVVRERGLQVMLTKRTAHLHDHAGQVSFPGGRVEEQDAHAAATALREAFEETGLDPAQVHLLGQLPVYLTSSNFHVTPVVGLVRPPLQLHADCFEVEAIFEVPLVHLMNPAHYELRTLPTPQGDRHFYAVRYLHHDVIWGATAGMLRNLYHFLRA